MSKGSAAPVSGLPVHSHTAGRGTASSSMKAPTSAILTTRNPQRRSASCREYPRCRIFAVSRVSRSWGIVIISGSIYYYILFLVEWKNFDNFQAIRLTRNDRLAAEVDWHGKARFIEREKRV